MGKHTIETLTADLDSFKEVVNRKFVSVNGSLKKMQPQVQEMHDFIIDQKGFERGQANIGKDGSIRISKDAWGLIIKLVTIIGVLVGIKLVTS